MSEQFTTINEECHENFNDFNKENFEINTNDLTTKTKLSFHKGRFQLSSNHAFNYLPRADVYHEYQLTHKYRNSESQFKQNALGETEVENKNIFYKTPTYQFGSYVNMKLDQGEFRRNFDATAQLRLFYKKKLYISFGIEEWDILEQSPSVVSVSSSYGKKTESNSIYSLNGYWKYDTAQKLLAHMKVFLTKETESFKGLLEVSNINTIDSSVVSTPNVNTDTPQDQTKSQKILSDINVALRFNHQYRENTIIGSNINYNINDKSTEAEVMINQKVDRVNVIAKVSTDRTISLGAKSEFDGLVVGVGIKSSLGCKTLASDDKEVYQHWVDTKFGFTAEFNRI